MTIVMFTSFVSPMTANIYFPVLNPIAEDLGVSIGLINLTLTTYMIFRPSGLRFSVIWGTLPAGDRLSYWGLPSTYSPTSAWRCKITMPLFWFSACSRAVGALALLP